MKNADIKIVGAVTDENALEEIESIAKVFAYEQRMKEYTSSLNKRTKIKKATLFNEKKMGQSQGFPYCTQPHILVKGLW